MCYNQGNSQFQWKFGGTLPGRYVHTIHIIYSVHSTEYALYVPIPWLFCTSTVGYFDIHYRNF